MTEQLEKEFLTWADEQMNTIAVEDVWCAASTFLKFRAPDYRTTATTSRLVSAFLDMRGGDRFSKKVERQLAELRKQITSLSC